MKLRLINILYALLILAALFGIFKLKQISKKNVEKIVSEIQSNVVIPVAKDPLSEILDRGLAAKCQFAQDLVNSKMTGDIYVANGIVRTDITAPNKSGIAKLAHTIIKDGFMYLWYDKNVSGMKAAIQPDAPESTSSEISALQNLIDLSDSFNFKCDEWEPDSFKFVIPPEITFIDAVEFADEMSKQTCLLCDQEDSEASRLLCKRELKCN